MKRSLGAFANLPYELLEDIMSHLTRPEHKNVRSVSSFFRDLATPFVFTTAFCAARRGVFDVFKAISNHSGIRQHIVELVFDASWFDFQTVKHYEDLGDQVTWTDPPTTYKGRTKYIEAFWEQELILEEELESALEHSFNRFPKLRRIIYADLSRLPGSQWDRVEDLGPDFRLGGNQWHEPQEKEIRVAPSVHIKNDSNARSRWFGLVLILKNLSRDSCQIQLHDLRLGDSAYSRGAGGVPLALIQEFALQNDNLSSRFASLRKLDITIDPDHLSYGVSDRCLFPAVRHLELLRLVGPPCSPRTGRYTPSLRKPAIRILEFWGEATWPRLQALELRRIASSTAELIALLKRHPALQYINLNQIYIDEWGSWPHLVLSLRSLYPNLVVEPYQDSRLHIMHQTYYPLIINFTFYNDEATIVNMSVQGVDDIIVDDYDEDQISNYWDSSNNLPPEEERYSSEELDFSEDGDTSEIEEIQDMVTSLRLNDENRRAGIPVREPQQDEEG
ncbi:MAG: hypothetical protein Q9222_005715 [Ikaeria aurantiellina]